MQSSRVGWNQNTEVKRTLFDEKWRGDMKNSFVTPEEINQLSHGLDRVSKYGSNYLVEDDRPLIVIDRNGEESDTEEEGEPRVENDDDIMFATLYSEAMTLSREKRAHSLMLFLYTSTVFTYKIMTSLEVEAFLKRATSGFGIMDIDLSQDDQYVTHILNDCFGIVENKRFFEFSIFVGIYGGTK